MDCENTTPSGDRDLLPLLPVPHRAQALALVAAHAQGIAVCRSHILATMPCGAPSFASQFRTKKASLIETDTSTNRLASTIDTL